MAAATSYRYRTGAWYFLDGVDVSNPEVDGAVVAFGASTSDGVGSTPGANERYPNDLGRRLLRLPAGLRLSVLNAGISRNRLLVGHLIHGYLRLIAAAHARGIAVVGCTLQPDEGAGYYSAQGNQVRQQVNRWIRTSGAFDAIVDFDAVRRDPADPVELVPAFDSGDHLHPSDAGYLAMARSISPWMLAALAIGYVHSPR